MTGPVSDVFAEPERGWCFDEAVSYYYLLDFEENWPGGFSRQPGEPDTIQWSGDEYPSLPEYPSDISDEHRYTASIAKSDCETERPDANEPRRYADPQ